MRNKWALTKRISVLVGLMITAAGLTVPSASYALKTLPGVLPAKVWDPNMAPYAIGLMMFAFAFKLVADAYLLVKNHLVPTLCKSTFPRYFYALGMLWPKRVSLEVWQPALEDEMARYYELKPKADLRILNCCFAWRMVWIILPTVFISATDWRMIFLGRKKPE